MNKLDSSQVQLKELSQIALGLPLSGIRKFFDLASSMDDVVSLGVGEPDFLTPWVARENAVYYIEKGHTNYTANQGLIELREQIADRYRNLYNIGYDPRKEILVTVGASQGIDLACRALLNPADEVIIPEPCFVAYKPLVLLAGGVPVTIATNQDTGFTFTIEQLEAVCTEKTKAILIGHPSNPTGSSLDKNLIEKLVQFAKRNGLYIISDEIYDGLCYDSKHTCISSINGAKERTIVLNGFSKTYAMTGWRLGYALASKEVIELMTRIHSHSMMCAPTPSQKAALAVLKSGEPDVSRMVAQYRQRRNLIVEGLNKLGLDCHLPAGAFYAFPSVGKFNKSSAEFAEQLLVEQHVAVVPGSVFGPAGEGYIRCSYATSTDNIEKALSRIEKFVSSH